MRDKIGAFVEGTWFVRFIICLILLNAVTLGLETSDAIMDSYGTLLHIADKIIVSIFVFELLLKFYAHRLNFFKSGWNIFDFIIVGIALVPTSESLSILRAFRIFRVLRLFSVMPQMRRVIAALFHALPGMSSVIGVLTVVFYISAVLTTELFGKHSDPELQEWFGSIGASMYTLFQIMTLESWSMGIVRPVLEHYPLAWIFFVPFIIITSFAVLNLFIGIIVDSMNRSQEEPRAENREQIQEVTRQEAQVLFEELQKVRSDMQEIKDIVSDKK